MKKKKFFVLLLVVSLLLIGLPSLSVHAYTEEEKQMVKEWLSAHGYSPDMSGAQQAYGDYLNGLYDSSGNVIKPEESGINADEATSATESETSYLEKDKDEVVVTEEHQADTGVNPEAEAESATEAKSATEAESGKKKRTFEKETGPEEPDMETETVSNEKAEAGMLFAIMIGILLIAEAVIIWKRTHIWKK